MGVKEKTLPVRLCTRALALLLTYLDPGEEDSNGDNVVELSLPKAKIVKVCILIWIFQKSFQQVINDHRTIKMEQDGNVTKQKNDNVEDVPKALEVLQFVFLDLQYLFDGVVDEEEHEDPFTSHDKVIESGHVADQF